MKSVLAICTLFLAAALVRSDEDPQLQKFIEDTKEHYASCATKVGMSLPTGMPSMADMPTLSPENMDKMNCVHACVMGELTMMVDGKIDAGNMKTVIENMFPEESAAMIKNGESCFEEANAAGDECAVARTFIDCVKKFETN